MDRSHKNKREKQPKMRERPLSNGPNCRSVLCACYKVVARSPCVRNETVQGAVGVKDDSVGAGRAARVRIVAGQDREFVPRAGGGKGKALVVVVLVRVTT